LFSPGKYSFFNPDRGGYLPQRREELEEETSDFQPELDRFLVRRRGRTRWTQMNAGTL
jgi:hypothetical protein